MDSEQENLPTSLIEEGYLEFVQDLKERILTSKMRAGFALNAELIGLYWSIGKEILLKEKQKGWGAKVVTSLARDLRKEFPEMKGFSARNLRYCKAFAESYPVESMLQAGPAKITWYHNCTLLDKVKDDEERQWYVNETIRNGWSRDVMVHQIESQLYARQGKAITNFVTTLPAVQSELAQQVLKDPYNFDFLSLGSDALERDLEKGLLEKLRDFLLELGTGFAFVGSQYHLEVGGQDYFIDILFYHLKLRCYVVVELKITDFMPEYAGKMSFYLSAVDELLKLPEDKPSIGLLLCKTTNRIVAEYSVRNFDRPMGIAEYKLAGEPLPEPLRQELPTVEILEAELDKRLIEPDARVALSKYREMMKAEDDREAQKQSLLLAQESVRDSEFAKLTNKLRQFAESNEMETGTTEVMFCQVPGTDVLQFRVRGAVCNLRKGVGLNNVPVIRIDDGRAYNLSIQPEMQGTVFIGWNGFGSTDEFAERILLGTHNSSVFKYTRE